MPAVNLLPRELRPQVRTATPRQLAVLAGILAAAAVLGLFWGNYWQAARQLAQVRAARQSLAPATTEAAELQKELAAMAKERQALEEAWALRFSWSGFLADLRRCLPENVRLTALTIKGAELVVDGEAETAADLADFLARLGSVPSLRAPSLVRAEGGSPLKFTIKANLARPLRTQSEEAK